MYYGVAFGKVCKGRWGVLWPLQEKASPTTRMSGVNLLDVQLIIYANRASVEEDLPEFQSVDRIGWGASSTRRIAWIEGGVFVRCIIPGALAN